MSDAQAEPSKPPRKTHELIAYLKNDRWNWWFLIIVGIAVILVVALLCRYQEKPFWDKWDYADRIVSLATLMIVLLGWYAGIRKAIEHEQPVRIVLRHGDLECEIPYRPLRAQLSRAELAGILSTYYGKDRFDPAMLHDLLDPPDGQESGLSAAIKGTSDDIQIELEKKSFDTFDRFLKSQDDGESSRLAVKPFEPIERRVFVRCGERYSPPDDEGWTVITLPQELKPQDLPEAVARVRKAIAHSAGARLVIAGPVMLSAALAQGLAHDPVPIEYVQLDQVSKAFDVWLTNRQNL